MYWPIIGAILGAVITASGYSILTPEFWAAVVVFVLLQATCRMGWRS